MKKVTFILCLVVSFVVFICIYASDKKYIATEKYFVIQQGWPPFSTYEFTEEECENASNFFEQMVLKEDNPDEITLGEGIDFTYYDGKKEVVGNIRNERFLTIDGICYSCNKDDAFCQYVQMIYMRQFPYGNQE